MAPWIVGLAVALVSGCATRPHMPVPEPRLAELGPLKRAMLVTDGVEIEVLDPDGSMPARIVPNEPFRPGRLSPYAPKVVDVEVEDLGQYDSDGGYYGFWWITDNDDTPPLVRRVIPGSPADQAGLGDSPGVYLMKLAGKGMATADDVWSEISVFRRDVPVGERIPYAACRNPARNASACPDSRGTLEAAAQPRPYRVRVHVPGRDEPLYGRLAFFHVHSTAAGSASRIYRLQIPQQYVDRARGGNVSVVYQPYEWKHRSALSGNVRTEEDPWASWALWLSDVPFD